MHIPDGFLSPPVWGSLGLVSAAGLALTIRKSQEKFEEKLVPLTGILCAFIFAAQMINFPVLAGTSGHLVGATLAAVFLGPWIGSLVLALVLIVQTFLFQDGGVTVLGANIFNMGFAAVWVSYLIFRGIYKSIPNKGGFLVAVAVASWCSIMASAFFCAVQLGISGTYDIWLTLKAIMFVHAFIGIGEALITLVVVSSVLEVRSDLVPTYNVVEVRS